MDLAQKKCVACEGGIAPFNRVEADTLLHQVDGWQLSDDGKSITKTISLENFADALAYANKIGSIAEEEGHHPDLLVKWGSVRVDLTTHAINGLSENDFILAAKIDTLSH